MKTSKNRNRIDGLPKSESVIRATIRRFGRETALLASILLFCGGSLSTSLTAQVPESSFGGHLSQTRGESTQFIGKPPHYTDRGGEKKAPHPAGEADDAYSEQYRPPSQHGAGGSIGDANLSKLEEGLLLLKSGFVLEGEVVLQGENYSVTTSEAHVRVPRESVRYLGRSKFELYLFQKSEIAASDVNAIVELAEWCHRHGLEEESRLEFRRAMESANHPTSRSFVERRMKMIQYLSRVQEEVSRDPPPPNRLREEIRALEEWSKDLPATVLGDYVGNVQRLLVNRCGMADCHGESSDQEFRLKRSVTDAVSRQTSLRNLRATLALVDRKDPKSSPLLTVPIRRHGGTDPIFTKRTMSQYKQVMEWVQVVATEMPHFRQSVAELALDEIYPNGPNQKTSDHDSPVASEFDVPAVSNTSPVEQKDVEHESESARPETISAGFFSPQGSARPTESASYRPSPSSSTSANDSPDRSIFGPASPASPVQNSGDRGIDQTSGFGEAIDMSKVRRIQQTAPDSDAFPPPNETSFPGLSDEPETLRRNAPQRRLQRAGILPDYTPRDPFDPEIFNRQYAAPKNR